MSQQQPSSSAASAPNTASAAVAGTVAGTVGGGTHGIAVQPLTEWLAVMTEEVQRKEEAARAAAAESKTRG